ncbi:hypothetical protein DSUL_140097 [Desulfovibrionales bacterium]
MIAIKPGLYLPERQTGQSRLPFAFNDSKIIIDEQLSDYTRHECTNLGSTPRSDKASKLTHDTPVAGLDPTASCRQYSHIRIQLHIVVIASCHADYNFFRPPDDVSR